MKKYRLSILLFLVFLSSAEADGYNNYLVGVERGGSMGAISSMSTGELHKILIRNSSQVQLGEIGILGNFVSDEDHSPGKSKRESPTPERRRRVVSRLVSTFYSIKFEFKLDNLVATMVANSGEEKIMRSFLAELDRNGGVKLISETITPQDARFKEVLTEYLKGKYNLDAEFVK